MKSIITSLREEFKCPVYSDEVLEKFKKPCFFIAASSKQTTHSVNWLHKELTIGVTYYARDAEKNELVYMDVVDRVQEIFAVGIRAADRYLHIDTIEDDRVGEEQDILQIEIVIPYIERVAHAPSIAVLMGEVSMVTITGETPEQEIWKTNIDENTI